MTKSTFMKGLGNIVYNNIVQTPFSIAKGLAWTHCIPSHFNYFMKMERSGFVEQLKDDVSATPLYDINEEKMDSQPDKKKLFKSHFYSKILTSGIGSIKTKSDLEGMLSVIPQFFISLIAGASAVGGYVEAVKEYGYKALIPV